MDIVIKKLAPETIVKDNPPLRTVVSVDLIDNHTICSAAALKLLRVTEEEGYDGSSYLPNRNKENESSWVFGSKNQSKSSGTVRKRNSRGIKRKIFEESDIDIKVMETQDQIKNCLLAIKSIAEKQLNIQEKLLNVVQDVSVNQELIINKLNHLYHGQNNTNVLLEAIGGFHVLNQ